MDQTKAEDLVRRLANALRGTDLYSPQDRTSLMALTVLTALKKYDNYTFTHMVNVSALAHL
jgi:hypothetical protein